MECCLSTVNVSCLHLAMFILFDDFHYSHDMFSGIKSCTSLVFYLLLQSNFWLATTISTYCKFAAILRLTPTILIKLQMKMNGLKFGVWSCDERNRWANGTFPILLLLTKIPARAKIINIFEVKSTESSDFKDIDDGRVFILQMMIFADIFSPEINSDGKR